MFIHNSRSENSRITTASAPAVWRRISVAILTFIAGFPQTDFDTKLVNFFLELVLPVILKELKSNFSFLLYVYFKNCHINKLDNYFLYLVLAYFLESFMLVFIVAAIVFPQSFYPNIKSKKTDAIQNNNKKRFGIYLKTENG